MTMEIYQGTPGGGKSASVIANLVDWLLRGGVVASNFKLADGWPYILADTLWSVRLGWKDRHKVADDLWSRYMVIGSPSTLWDVSDKLIPMCKGRIAKQYEGRGRMFIDEAQLYFNSRSWSKNMDFIHFFSQHRKKKWDVYLVAHSRDMIDKQVRFFCEYETRFRNLQKIKIPILQIPLSPIPIFVGVSRYAGIAAGTGEIAKRAIYPLHRWAYDLYDSAAVFDQSLEQEASHCGPRPLAGGCNDLAKVDQGLKLVFDDIKDKKWGLDYVG